MVKLAQNVSNENSTNGLAKNVTSICAILSAAHLSNIKEEKISLNMKNVNTVDGNLLEFPYSLLLLGSGLKELHLSYCGIESLPTTFGLHFKELNVSQIYIYLRYKRHHSLIFVRIADAF